MLARLHSFEAPSNPSRCGLHLAILLFIAIGLLNGPADAQTNSEPDAVVGMTNTLEFTPDTVRVQVGETVLWKNDSVIVHTVTADDEEATMDKSLRLPEGAAPFNSGDLEPEETFEYTFEVPGRYRYFCVPHEAAMRGTVIVEPKDKH